METVGSVPREARRAVPGGPAGASRPPEGVWRFTAPAIEASVPGARREVRELLRRQRVPTGADLVENLLLIVSELVTNAVQHAALLSPEIAVEVAVEGGWVRVAVEDEHPFRPRALAAGQDCTSGRGLLLVQAITAEAGGVCDVEHTASGGKAVWAALPLPPAEAPDAVRGARRDAALDTAGPAPGPAATSRPPRRSAP